MDSVRRLLQSLPRVEAVGALLFIVLATIILVASGRFPVLPWRFGGSPAFFPRILSILIIVLALLMVWDARHKPTPQVLPPRGRRILMVFAVLCIAVMPTLLLPYLGFPLSAFLFMLALMPALAKERVDGRRALKYVGIAVVVVGIIYVAFTYLARVPLPRGSLLSSADPPSGSVTSASAGEERYGIPA